MPEPIRWRGSNPEIEETPTATLAERLEQITAQIVSLVPPEKMAPITRSISEVTASGIGDRILPVGAKAPAFELPDAAGRVLRSTELLAKGRLVIVFYRGRWCPYCVATLEALEMIRPEITSRGAALVAISPQKPQHTAFTSEQHRLGFPVLSDIGNKITRQFGLAWELPQYLQRHYRSVFVNLPFINGIDAWELPIPATYVLDTDGTVLFAEASADFRRRTEPSVILSSLGE